MKNLITTYLTVVGLSWGSLWMWTKDYVIEISMVLITGLLVVITQAIMRWIKRKLGKSKLERDIITGIMDDLTRLEDEVIDKILEDRGDIK